jgi:CoA:oxalate CoA-transferase
VPVRVAGQEVQAFGTPMKLSQTPANAVGAAPGFGEHNEPVLRGWLGVAPDEYASLARQGVI